MSIRKLGKRKFVMLDLKNVTNEQLKTELMRRVQRKANAPEPVVEPDFSSVIKLAVNIRDEIVGGEYHEDSAFPQYMFEEAMKAVYGDDFFVWFNKNV
jgi:hypothetical protein